MVRYGALKIISTLLSLVGWLVLVIGILASLILLAGFITDPTTVTTLLAAQGLELNISPLLAGLIVGAIGIVGSLVISVPILAAAEAVRIFVDIEANTRQMADLLRKSQHQP